MSASNKWLILKLGAVWSMPNGPYQFTVNELAGLTLPMITVTVSLSRQR